jgi:hypothetical protein
MLVGLRASQAYGSTACPFDWTVSLASRYRAVMTRLSVAWVPTPLEAVMASV